MFENFSEKARCYRNPNNQAVLTIAFASKITDTSIAVGKPFTILPDVFQAKNKWDVEYNTEKVTKTLVGPTVKPEWTLLINGPK
jgi:hypothetical protein